jgi:hypothetical protein
LLTLRATASFKNYSSDKCWELLVVFPFPRPHTDTHPRTRTRWRRRYYLTGTSNSAGDKYWTDVWGVVRVWRSRTPLTPGSYVGGGVVFNLTRDCRFCGNATAAGGCRAPNSCAVCGVGANTTTDGGCEPATDCGGRVWAPELHYLPDKADAVPGSGGWFISFHFHCSGGGSGLLRSTTGSPFGPFTDLVHGVSGGDVSLFQDGPGGDVYAISSGGGGLYASLLSDDMRSIQKVTIISPKCSDAPCATTAIGFEGPFAIKIGSAYFLSSSAFGDAAEHGGPTSSFDKPGAPGDSHYSSFMGVATSFLGPYTAANGKPGSWLAVDSGGHNNYFSYNGTVYGTLWYGSEPNNDVPAADSGLINLPSVVAMEVVDGRLIAKHA